MRCSPEITRTFVMCITNLDEQWTRVEVLISKFWTFKVDVANTPFSLLDSCNQNWFLVFYFAIFSMLFKLFIFISVVLTLLRAWILNKIHHWIDLLCFSFPFTLVMIGWTIFVYIHNEILEIILNVMCFFFNKNNCRLWPYITPLYSTRWLEISNISII